MSALFGAVLLNGRVARVINPDFEYELAAHHVGPLETMAILKKADFGVSPEPNSMTLAHVDKITKVLNR